MSEAPANVPPAENRLPLHRLLFMPWRWSRWLQAALVVLLLGSFPAYILSAVPAYLLMENFDTPDEVEEAVATFYLPAEWCVAESEFIEAVIDWEQNFFFDCCGL